MKFCARTMVLLSVFVLAVAAIGGTASAMGKVRCLLVGIDDYGGNGDLVGCVADVDQMSDLLKRKFGKTRTTVNRMVDDHGDGSTVTWSGIQAAVRRIAAESTTDDYFYFYYSGHGAEDSSLALPNEDVSPRELASTLSEVNAFMTCVIVDSCFSGGLASDLRQEIKTPRLILALAVGPKETAKTCGGGVCPANSSEGSVFTRWLVEAMSDRSTNINGDDIISWREASQVASRQIAGQRYRRYLQVVPGYMLEIEQSVAMTPVFYQRR